MNCLIKYIIPDFSSQTIEGCVGCTGEIHVQTARLTDSVSQIIGKFPDEASSPLIR